jgi:type II secretory pathway pseudopilin PulG
VARCYKGQTLIEVIVAMGTISILLVALLALVVLSLKNTRLARDRAQAAAIGQEGIELMRAYRDYNWDELKGLANGNNYRLPANWIVTDGLSQICNSQPDINDIFWRCVQLQSLSSKEIRVTVTTGWNEGSESFTSVQATQISLWER